MMLILILTLILALTLTLTLIMILNLCPRMAETPQMLPPTIQERTRILGYFHGLLVGPTGMSATT